MEIANCLPEFFVRREADVCKIYMTTIYNSEETQNVPICVLWPIVSMKAGTLSPYHSPDKRHRPILSRTWNEDDHVACEWEHLGLELEVTQSNNSTLYLPVIKFIGDENCILPFNDRLLTIPRISQESRPRQGRDVPAKQFKTDPYYEVYPRNTTTPTAIKPTEVSAAKEVVKYISFIPNHVKRILVTNSISRNEPCPISYEDITETTASVTSCGHVFNTAAIQNWLSRRSANSLCPVCKQTCTV